MIVPQIQDSCAKGSLRRKEDMQLAIKKIFDEHPERRTPFKNNMPGKGLVYGWQRNPDVLIRNPESVTSANGNVSENNIKTGLKIFYNKWV